MVEGEAEQAELAVERRRAASDRSGIAALEAGSGGAERIGRRGAGGDVQAAGGTSGIALEADMALDGGEPLPARAQ